MDEKRRNREIKFRAFDKNGDGMFYGIQGGIEFEDGSHYTFDKFLTPNSDDVHDWVIMQYTGLKDKNGKEIYEGDVIEYKKETFPEDSDVLVYVTKRDRIVFSGGQFQASKSSFGWEGEDLIYLPTSTVIGNIYENPELSES